MNKTINVMTIVLPLLTFQANAQDGMQAIAASQLGYTPAMKKQFSSPVEFTSFEVRRVSDSSTVFVGGAPLRQVSSPLINDSSVWIGDFTPLTTPGRYRIVSGTWESYPFTIGTDIFERPVRAAQRFFYYQRAFTAVEMPYADGPWVHPTNAGKAPAGVVKGWHDAGNYAVYMPTMTQTIFWLLEAWSDFRPMSDSTNIPESGNGIPDLLDEARWGLEWVLSMQDTSGGFWGTVCPGCDDLYDYGITTPNTVDPFCRAIPPTVQNTAKAVAVLSYASVVYTTYDAFFAGSCLLAALSGWAWMVNNPTATDDSGQCDAYAQGSDSLLLKTNRMWAAAGLLFATGDPLYEAAFQGDFVPIDEVGSFQRSEAFASSLYLRAPAGANRTTQDSIRFRIFDIAAAVTAFALTHPFQYATRYYWGTNSNAMHYSGQFLWRAYILDTTRIADRDQALFNLDYIFGRNFNTQCYVSGIDSVSNPRERGFHHWMKALNTSPWHFPGALAGGPNEFPHPNDISYPYAVPYPIWGYWGDTTIPRTPDTPIDARFTDNDSWSTNECAINWNAVLLYNLYAARQTASGRMTGTPPGSSSIPTNVQLYQNYPNPFNPITTIRFKIPGEVGSQKSEVTLKVYNPLGQEVATLVKEVKHPGEHRVQWGGAGLPSGVYFCRLTVRKTDGARLDLSGGQTVTATRKMLILR